MWARTAHLYVFPAVRLGTTIGLSVPVADRAIPPFDDVQLAVYFGVESALPFAWAAVRRGNDTRSLPAATLAAPGVATRAGAPTTIAGDAADAAPVPTAFVAVTVHAYDRFNVAPPTVIGAAEAPRCTADFVTPPLLDLQVAVNFVIGDPLFAPATYETMIGPLVAEVVDPGRATTCAGFAGADGGLASATL